MYVVEVDILSVVEAVDAMAVIVELVDAVKASFEFVEVVVLWIVLEVVFTIIELLPMATLNVVVEVRFERVVVATAEVVVEPVGVLFVADSPTALVGLLLAVTPSSAETIWIPSPPANVSETVEPRVAANSSRTPMKEPTDQCTGGPYLAKFTYPSIEVTDRFDFSSGNQDGKHCNDHKYQCSSAREFRYN